MQLLVAVYVFDTLKYYKKNFSTLLEIAFNMPCLIPKVMGL